MILNCGRRRKGTAPAVFLFEVESVASISRESNGRRTVQFVGSDNKRRSIRLGKVSQRAAEIVKLRVELILSAQSSGGVLDDETARWLASLDQAMNEKLAAVGLTDRRQSSNLGQFIKSYVAERVDVKPATKEVWKQGERGLVEALGANRLLRNITPGDADSYKLKMVGEGLAPYTIRKRLQFAKTIFHAAVRHKLVLANPFADVRVAATMEDRKHFVSMEDTTKLLEAAPDHHWRSIIALARFAGLRCPSEVLSLRWQDIDWARERMVVTAPKTEHHPGKGKRIVPIFGDLRPWLDEAFEAAPKKAVYVVDERFRHSANTAAGWRNCNLRTTFQKIIERAGLTPWPRLFHNLRSSCETELMRRHPMPTVVAWLGHTEEIARRHYCQVTDAEFAEAASHRSPVDHKQAVQNPVQYSTVSGRTVSQSPFETSAERGDSTPDERARNERRMGWDSNPRYDFS